MAEVFNEEEFDGKSGAQQQQHAALIKQRFDHRRARIHHFRTQYPLNEYWNELNQIIIDFDTNKFNSWNQRWSAIHRTNDLNQFKIYFNEGNRLFDDMDSYLSTLPLPDENTQEIDALKNEVLNNIQSDFINLKNEVSLQIDEGINKLVGLEAELGLEKNFKTNIENDLKKSNNHRYAFLAGFIFSVLIIPIFLVSTFIFEVFKNLEYMELLLLRFGITLSLAVLSYFCFNQYKLYQLISLRYSHLYGFLGGGATFINQLIGGEDESKNVVNKRMAELFMELEMLNGQVKKTQHPIEMTIDKAIEVVEKVSKVSKQFKTDG